MKRFIDLRHTFDDTGVNFAWWDTVTDCFEIHCGIGGFETWRDFVGWYKGNDIERYKGLCPEWVFELNETDETCDGCVLLICRDKSCDNCESRGKKSAEYLCLSCLGAGTEKPVNWSPIKGAKKHC